MKLKAKELVKILLSRKYVKQKELVDMLNKRTSGRRYSSGSLSQKLCRGTISYDEVALIADILGFDIEFVDRHEEI